MMSAHDSRIRFKLDEIEDDLQALEEANTAVGIALNACDKVLADAQLKNLTVKARRQEIAADIAILKEMLGLQ